MLVFLLFGFLGCQNENPPASDGNQPDTEVFYNGVDLSFTAEIEGAGISFSDSGQILPVAEIFKRRGVNIVRLRLWHTPSSSHSNLSEVLDFARIVKAKGMDILLDIHYSDTWADPSQQAKPLAWNSLSFAELADSVYTYSHDVMNAFIAQETPPLIVQIGNEINSGFLWNSGRVGGSFDTNWINFGSLLKKAIAGIHDAEEKGETKVMLHYAGTDGADWFFQNIRQQEIPYDIIGISYYPFWHGKNLDSLKTALNGLAHTFQKDIFIVETGYPWTLSWNDWTNNIVGLESQLIPEYPSSPDGQRRFLYDLKHLVRGLHNHRGIGWCYWAPEYVAFRGPQATNGSSWENGALFDFTNTSLPSISIFTE